MSPMPWRLLWCFTLVFAVLTLQCVSSNHNDTWHTGDSRSKKLPFIFAPGDYELNANVTLLPGEAQHVLNSTRSEWNHVLVNPDGSLVGFASADKNRVCRDGPVSSSCSAPKLRVGFAPSAKGPWTERTVELPLEIDAFSNPSGYIENNGTVTLILDTCTDEEGQLVSSSSPSSLSCLTIAKAENGCTVESCNTWQIVGQPNVLPVPMNCSLNPNDPFYACPCRVEHPAIWYDKPMQRWRMLVHQYPSRVVDGRCVPQRDHYENAGGYAETTGESAVGPWIFDSFQQAYGNEMRFQAETGDRLLIYTNFSRRERPRVVLGPDGGLDDGYIVNDVCENVNGSTTCGTRILEVLQSTLTPEQRVSGTIYLIYHAETANKTWPLGIGQRGLERANYLPTIYNDHKFKVPKTVIAAQVVDDKKPGRGQRMHDTVVPLAKSLGMKVTRGPTLIDSPNFSHGPARAGALQALEALQHGPVLVAYWSYIEEFCEQLGTTTRCENFMENGEMYVIEVEDGNVVSTTRDYDCYNVETYEWDDHPRMIQDLLQALGYNKTLWDEGIRAETEDKLWDELSPAELEAAIRLGYLKDTWESDLTLWKIFVKFLWDCARKLLEAFASVEGIVDKVWCKT